MRPSLWDYVREAFNARPIGMFVPPNWAMLAGFGLASGWFREPGFLVLGAGVELGYLLLLGTNARFQRFVAGKLSAGGSREVEERWQQFVSRERDELDANRKASQSERLVEMFFEQFSLVVGRTARCAGVNKVQRSAVRSEDAHRAPFHHAIEIASPGLPDFSE